MVPTDVAGLKLWLKADAGVEEANGDPCEDLDPVLNWLDQSGQGNHATQGTPGSQPVYRAGVLNGKPTIRFDGVNDLLTGPNIAGLGSGSVTIFVVASGQSIPGSQEDGFFSVGGYSNGFWFERQSYQDTLTIFNSNGQLDGTSYMLDRAGFSAKILAAVKVFGSSWTFYVDRLVDTATTSAGTVDSWTDTTYKVGQSEPTFFYKGDIFEVIIYSSALGTIDRQGIEDYLYNKYFVAGGAALSKAVADTISTLADIVTPLLIPQPIYFGSAAVPADGAAAVNATTTITITPPASMLLGDLVVVSCVSGANATWSNGVTGGQTWTAETAYAGTAGPWCRTFWCRFNGTWGANPRFDSTVGTNTSAIMHVFRPPSTTDVWAIDVAQATTQYTAPTTPFTVSRTGLTTAHANAITLAFWHSFDDNTWGNIAGTGWVVTGTAQYRNTSGTPDNSSSFAHHIDLAASSVVPTVSKQQTALGGDAGVTSIIAWYAQAVVPPLTKSLSDGLTLTDLRSGVAGFARSLPDPMTITEALARIYQGQRLVADALTMSESIGAVKALVRAFVDPLTMGENLAAVKALLRAFADALILGELVDKQLTMAAYSDTFNRADSGTVGASWNENVAGCSIIGNTLSFTNVGSYSSAVWTQPVAISCQYQKATVSWNPGTVNIIGMLFRCSNTSNGSCYRVSFNTGDDAVLWENVANMTAPATSTSIGTSILAIAPGNTIGITLELLGNNTVVRIWLNPTGLPARADNWNGDTTPNVTMTQNPATPRDAGTFVGLVGAPLEASADLRWDNWFAGGCLESTGILWAKELFDDLVMSEALSTLAILFRTIADPITLNEALGRVAALQRYAMDPLTLGDNVSASRALARSYVETLTLGEALAKRAGKLFADAITLGEAFSKQLQVARALADPMTLNEVFAKQAQFRRSQVDTIALGENLTIPLQGVKGLADPLTLGEVLARVTTHRRSLIDSVTMGETLNRHINRAIADLVTMSEAVAKLFGKNISNPMTLGEVVAKQKQIGKAVSDVIAMSEVLTKIFVGIKNLADPLLLSETVSKQILGAFTRSLADSITMVGNAFTESQYFRAGADPLTLGEALARQAQFKRSIADLVTLGEAIQKVVVLVRNISNAITMSETVAKSAAFARSQVDPLTLNEALAKLLGIARALSDSMTVGDALAKSATFRRAMADVMTMADTGTRLVLRQLLADAITMADVVQRTKIFLRFYADPITMTDSVTKLFVLLRIFSDSLSLDERLIRLTVFHRLPVDTIGLAEVFAKGASYKRSAEDPLSLGEALNGISAFRVGAKDILELGEAIQATGLLQKAAADPITLADVIDTKFVTFAPPWARRPYNIGAGGVTCP